MKFAFSFSTYCMSAQEEEKEEKIKTLLGMWLTTHLKQRKYFFCCESVGSKSGQKSIFPITAQHGLLFAEPDWEDRSCS